VSETPLETDRKSTVIKARRARRDGLQLRVFSLGDIEAEASRILAEAGAEARSLVSAAERRSRDLARESRRQAQQEGYQQGLADGRKDGEEQALAEAREEFKQKQQRLISALTEVVSELDLRKRRLLSQAHKDLVSLAVSIARKVIKSVAEASPAVAEQNVREAVKLTGSASDVVVRVHPEERESLALVAGEIIEQFGQLKHVRLVADESVDRGGCVVQTEAGQVDGRTETQVSRIAEELLGSEWGAANR
jgi:flagellar assembly protein FliH